MVSDYLSADIREFLRKLHAHQVRYLVVGGEAVIYHGYPRLTGDVDFFFEANAENARKLFGALQDFWGGEVPSVESAEELLVPGLLGCSRIHYGAIAAQASLILDTADPRDTTHVE